MILICCYLPFWYKLGLHPESRGGGQPPGLIRQKK
jgi:hypothetical protein